MNKLKKILLVDDEAGIRRLLFDALSGEGFHVTLAKDGQESLDQLENNRFDLLITDIHMPHLDGIELLKKMKRAGRKERVIIMTGKPVDQTLFGSDTLPVFTHLHKPFEIHNFLEVVTSAFAKPAKKKKRA
ncbi:MAG: response regulator [Deltaproteobacteria bacterium]|jgi:DNA-binding NtrC family response regulator|nr:MAG: response regulator [Deltaproteobacteria bacterium]